MFRRRRLEAVNDPVEELLKEFWRVNDEINRLQKSYNTTRYSYVDCTIHDINAKVAYRNTILDELRAFENVDWGKYTISKCMGISGMYIA